nr:carboxypeptidase-like regulatory domain-containing protein [Acidobacteriota bacterium]
MRRLILFCGISVFAAGMAMATVFGTVRGIVHDPQHRPVADIAIVLAAKDSAYSVTEHTDVDGQFHFDAVPLGEYRVTVS